MHEFSLTQSLLETALKSADSKRIVKVNLLIGPFSEEREESIQLYWRDLAKGTLGEGAKIHFQHVKADMKCLGCARVDELERGAPGPRVRDPALKLVKGRLDWQD